MVQVFISYSRADRELASKLAERLTEEGYDVWWDAALLGGSRFEDEIKRVLREAPAAIILWSKSSATSDWVRAEASIAREAGTAVPLMIDDVSKDDLPIPYQQIHLTRFVGWDGAATDEKFQAILKSVSRLVGKSPGPKLSESEAHTRLNDLSEEAALWADLEKSSETRSDDYRQYLKRYGPNSRFAGMAESRVRRLQRRERRWWIVGGWALAALLVVGGSTIVMRPDLLKLVFPDPVVVVETCPDDRIVQAPTLPISLCVDGRVWKSSAEAVNSRTYETADKLFSFQIKTSAAYLADDAFLESLITLNDSAPTTNGKTEATAQETRFITDRNWTIFSYKRPFKKDDGIERVEYNRTYYYGAAGLGSFELTIWTNQPETTLPGLGDPLARSVVFDWP